MARDAGGKREGMGRAAMPRPAKAIARAVRILVDMVLAGFPTGGPASTPSSRWSSCLLRLGAAFRPEPEAAALFRSATSVTHAAEADRNRNHAHN